MTATFQRETETVAAQPDTKSQPVIHKNEEKPLNWLQNMFIDSPRTPISETFFKIFKIKII